ncbi:MAG: IS21-like element helper ATPase IstB [Myxococcota bacterium]
MTAGLQAMLRALKLPGVAANYRELTATAERSGWSFEQYLSNLLEIELAERKRRRIERLVKQSQLPSDKTLATLDQGRLPVPVRRVLGSLCEGGFVERGENVLLFGLPGRGKTHVVAAIGHELVRRGHSVLFVPAFALVQRLLAARRGLELEKALRQLDGFDVIVLDDIGYIQQDREEMEVLFTFLAERYERRSVMITSNLVFSQWDRIFKDAMTTAAAVDRLVHHATILELTGGSVRNEEARERMKGMRTEAGADADTPAVGAGATVGTPVTALETSGGPPGGASTLADARDDAPLVAPPDPRPTRNHGGEAQRLTTTTTPWGVLVVVEGGIVVVAQSRPERDAAACRGSTAKSSRSHGAPVVRARAMVMGIGVRLCEAGRTTIPTVPPGGDPVGQAQPAGIVARSAQRLPANKSPFARQHNCASGAGGSAMRPLAEAQPP